MQKDHQRLPCLAHLENAVQQYAWGDTQGILPFIDAHAGPGYPIGEVWMGSHGRAPSKLRLDAGSLPLDELIRRLHALARGPRRRSVYEFAFSL